LPIRLAAAFSAFILIVGPASAHDFKIGQIEIKHPWSRPTPPSAPVAGGYMKLTNTGIEADRLVEVVSPIAERAEIHRSVVENGIASMRPTEGLAVDPGATVDFEAEKLHVMFIKPKSQLKDGEKFPATLVFEKAGRVEIEFMVQARAAKPAAKDHSSHSGSK